MYRVAFYLYWCGVVLTLIGCVAPGSAIGTLKLSGSVVSSGGEPIPNKHVEFILPAAYGLGGLDLILNRPEDFGQYDQRITAITDEHGNFEVNLGERVYHVNVWLLPPLGGFPSRPPAPFLLVRFPEIESEYYAVQTHDGAFKIYNYIGEEIPLEKSNMLDISALNKKGNNAEYRETVSVLRLQLRGK